jgi:hypothetical protein
MKMTLSQIKNIIIIIMVLQVTILFFKCAELNIENIDLQEQLKAKPEIIWKEFNTKEYIEVPVEKIIYKTIYKEKVCVEYDNGLNIIDIK